MSDALTDDAISLAQEFRRRRPLRKNRLVRLQRQRQTVVTGVPEEMAREAYRRRKAKRDE